ncbi:MAG: hypothetical protein ACOY94_03035 [Bacillota bacterium]
MIWLAIGVGVAGFLVWMAMGELWPLASALGFGLLLGTLWYIANLLERIAIKLEAVDPPVRQADPEELLRRRPGRLAGRQKYHIKHPPQT